MKRLTLYAEAQSELKAAVVYYEAIDPDLGRDLRARVHRAFREIRKNPARYPLHKESRIRRCTVSRFPYTIYYLETPDRIWVVAIAHQKRKPDYWRARSMN